MNGNNNNTVTPAKDYLCSYPIEALIELQVGVTTIDFWDGIVTNPDKSTDTISVALHDVEYDVFKSLYINTEHKIHVWATHRGYLNTYIDPGITSFLNIEFDKLKIEAFRLTNFRLHAHTDPYGIPKVDAFSYKENIPYVVRSAVATAGTYDELDIRSSLGRDATSGFITNMGNTGGDLHVWEYDGVNWTSDYYTIGPDGVINYSDESIQKIRIDATVDNTQYEVRMK